LNRLSRTSDKFVESIYAYSNVIIQVGSFVYNPPLCTDESDLDYIVVCDEKSIESVLVYGNVFNSEQSEEFLRAYREMSKIDNADSIICKSRINGVKISFNILNPRFFLHNCRMNIDEDDELIECWKFWNDYERNKVTKVTSFDGNIVGIPKIVRSSENYWLNRTPVGVTIDGKYYVGYYQDQIICGGQTKKCNPEFSEFEEMLFDTLSQRLLIDFPEIAEYDSLTDIEEGSIGFHRSICRRDDISNNLRQQLARKTKECVHKWI